MADLSVFPGKLDMKQFQCRVLIETLKNQLKNAHVRFGQTLLLQAEFLAERPVIEPQEEL